MLRPAEMKKIRVYALKSVLPEVIKSLHELGLVEIRRFKIEGLERGRPLEFFDEVSSQLIKLRNTTSNMDAAVVKSAKPKELDIDGKSAVEMAKKIDADTGAKLRGISREAADIKEQITKTKQQLQVVEKLQPFEIDFSRLSSKTVTYTVGEIQRVKIPVLKEKLWKVLKDYSMLAPDKKGQAKGVVLLLYGKTSPSPDSVLNELGFAALQLPEAMTTPAAKLSELNALLKEKEERLAKMEAERKAVSREHAAEVLGITALLDIEAERSEIPSRFAFSKSASVIEGWLKADDYEKLRLMMGKFGDTALLEELKIGEKEQPPIVLDNPGYSHPFEFITKSFSLPNYREFDPTFIYFIGLPIIYGMIVGDVIYGLFSLIIAYGFMKIFSKSPIMLSVAGIWFLSGFPTMLFGVIFDEWAGMTHAQWLQFLSSWGLPISTAPLYTAALHRLHDFSLLLGLTLLVGLIHVGIGFLLGAVTLWKHHRKHAIAKLAWLGTEIGGTIAIATGFFGLLPEFFMIPSLILAAISIFVLVYIEGAVGALELPGLVGNVLSYARIAAVGVAGVVLAEIINDFFLPVPEAGLMALLLFPLLIILHFVNTFIAMFESIIQVGRLNIIEFRSKFLEGGGVLFSPFALKKQR